MKKTLLLASVLVTLSAGNYAYADDDCYVPMSKWQSRDAVRSMAEAKGWNVRRIKIDDGCYEIKGRDAKGRKIEVKIDPATLAVIELEYEDDDDNYGQRKRHRNKKGASAPTGPITPVNPPSNGLFSPGSKPKVITQ